jgi:hypothetical protein
MSTPRQSSREWFGTDAQQCRSVNELLGLATPPERLVTWR